MAATLYVFDLDYTLIDVDSSTMWCRYLAEHGLVQTPDFLAQEAALMAQYDKGSMDVHDYIDFSMRALQHLTRAEIEEHCRRYAQRVLRAHIFPQGHALVSSLLSRRLPLLIISASAAFIVRAAAELLQVPAEQVLAVEVETKGEYYGTAIVGQPPYQAGKVACLQEWQRQHGYTDARVQVWTDSINDLPLCKYAERVHAVNPSAAFAAEALQRGFEILHWQR